MADRERGRPADEPVDADDAAHEAVADEAVTVPSDAPEADVLDQARAADDPRDDEAAVPFGVPEADALDQARAAGSLDDEE